MFSVAAGSLMWKEGREGDKGTSFGFVRRLEERGREGERQREREDWLLRARWRRPLNG
jgi:hypothetical protein